MVRHVHRFGSQDLDLLALEDGDVLELGRILARAVLDDHQARGQDLEHEAEAGDRPRRSPDDELAPIAPDAEMDPGALDRRREPRERARTEREGSGEHGMANGPVGGQEGQRYLRSVAFLSLNARPEGDVDQGLDRGRIGKWGARVGAWEARRCVPGEVVLEPGGKGPGGRIVGTVHLTASMLQVEGFALSPELPRHAGGLRSGGNRCRIPRTCRATEPPPGPA